MNYSIKPILDTRREKKNQTFPIKIRCIINKKTIDLSTPFNSKQNYWNKNAPYLSKEYGIQAREHNLFLRDKCVYYEKRISKLIEKGTIQFNMSNKELKYLLINYNSTLTFAFFENHISHLVAENKIGTARWYRQTSNVIQIFQKEKYNKLHDFKLQEINYKWLEDFSSWYLKRNPTSKSINGLSVKLRSIRAIINKAQNKGLIDYGESPFLKFKIKTQKTEKRALSKSNFKRLMEASPNPGWQERALDYFKFMYYAYGMSFRDMANLKLSNITKTRIRYRRAKTKSSGGIISILINESMRQILIKYSAAKNKDEYVFNIINPSKSEIQKYFSVKNAMKRFNTALKELAEKQGIEENITTYTARHCFASHLLENGNSIELISQMMGHQSVKTTQVYLKGFNNEKLDIAQAGLVIF